MFPSKENILCVKPEHLMLILKFVRRMKSSKHKSVNGQIFKRGTNIGPFTVWVLFCALEVFLSILWGSICHQQIPYEPNDKLIFSLLLMILFFPSLCHYVVVFPNNNSHILLSDNIFLWCENYENNSQKLMILETSTSQSKMCI